MTERKAPYVVAPHLPKRRSEPEELLATMIRLAGLPEPEREHRFAAGRRWRFDFCWPVLMVAVEVEGAVFQMGRHQRPGGFMKDMEKYNSATLAGWSVYRVTPQMVSSGEALALVGWAIKRVTGEE